MNNKIRLKKYIVLMAALAVALLAGSIFLNVFEYRRYTENYNKKLVLLIAVVQEKYPEVTEEEIIKLLNGDAETEAGTTKPADGDAETEAGTTKSADGDAETEAETAKPADGGDNTQSIEKAIKLLEKYGIDISKDSVIVENEREHFKYLLINEAVIMAALLMIILIFLKFDRDNSKDIAEITNIIQQINKRNYELGIDSVTEDELSILRHEIYKTTITLREAADNSDSDKRKLKRSLEDISHQLKTPLTGILVMLDNMIDDPEMDNDTREMFIRNIKREILNITFLVQSLLKLSKFDTNTISYSKELTDVGEIIADAVKNVSALCDLKNVKIEISEPEPVIIMCDPHWQKEAITNIIKNCLEHSDEGGKIRIDCEQNKVYSMIRIADNGSGISAKDLPHIFERFYKGENSSSDSVGIGLSLAKAIINEDNGQISVDSDGNGTTFTIKYGKEI